MPIPLPYANRFIYHFTHVDNLHSLVANGLLATNHPKFPAHTCRSIAADSIQERRATMRVPCGSGGVVHDYVPLYFGSLSPMLLGVINKKNVDQCHIVYFEFPIALVERAGAVFTDASANTNIPPGFYADSADLHRLNWAEIDSIKWSSKDETLRHQRMAEVLIPGRLDIRDAARIIVWNDAEKNRVESILKKFPGPFPPVEFEYAQRRHYFVKFNSGNEDGASIVTGPAQIYEEYRAACQAINDRPATPNNARFKNLDDLLVSLRQNFGCLPQTSELIGLRSENGIHKHSVDRHTADVVTKLFALPEFRNLPPDAQSFVELAAYLHDIGKGPKKRWASNGGLQRVDPNHPVRAMPMMVEIFDNDITSATHCEVNLLLKLVCYHDLVGEVLGKERDEQQIVDIASTVGELDMLFALGRADATSLVETWWDIATANGLYNRCHAAIAERQRAAR